MLEHEIVGRILDRADLLDDDVLLARNLLGIERRLRQDVGQHVEPERHVGFQDARIIGRHLDAGAGVEVAAHRLDLLGDLARGAARRALEGHVLEEMRDAVLVGVRSGCRNDPDAERSGLQMRHRVGDHDQDPGRRVSHRYAHAAAPSCAARLVDRTNCSTAD